MPPPRITQNFVNTQANNFIKDIHRALSLYNKICINGYVSAGEDSAPKKINQPDSRDISQFIFFEIAAKFEHFITVMFHSEVRARLKVTRVQADYIMGDADNGMDGKMGWAIPGKLMNRGKHILGNDSFFGNLKTRIGDTTFNHLISAHTARNRLAHSGGAAVTRFVKLLEASGIPAKERQGISVGRFIKDYPKTKPATEKNFQSFLAAYENFAVKAKSEILK